MSQALTTPPTAATLDPSDKARTALIQLAREVAINFEALSVILTRNGLTEQQYEKILNNPFYSRVLAATQAEWGGITNTEMRVRLKSAYFLEHALPEVFGRLVNPNEPLSAVNEGVKTLAKLAGIGEKGADPGDGEKFVISINLGPDKTITQEIKTIETKSVEIAGPDTSPEGTPHGTAPDQ